MNKERAQEIAASPIMAHVTYQNNAIYIESVDGNGNTAVVSPLHQRSKRYVAPLSDLIEP